VSNNSRISLQNPESSDSIFFLYSLSKLMCFDPFDSSFYSIEEIALQAVLLDPTEFLYATDNKFLSSIDNSYSV